MSSNSIRNIIAKAMYKELEDNAPHPSEEDEVESYQDLIMKYHRSQANTKNNKKKSKSSGGTASFFSLNFARFRRQLKGFRKTTTNTQVIGLTDSDTYEVVLSKACKALGLTCDISSLQLICSGGVVPNSPIGTKEWTLGEFVKNNGGSQNRGKKVWGIAIPSGYDESNTSIPCIPSSTSLPTSSDSGYAPNVRKRNCGNFQLPSKKQRLERTSVEVISSSGPLDAQPPVYILNVNDLIVKYSPMIDRKLNTSVVGLGLIGVWRMTQLDYVLSDSSVMSEMMLEESFQPETHDFFVTEIYKDSTYFLKNDIPHGSSITWDDITFTVKDNQYLVSPKVNHMEGDIGYVCLLVVAPDHRRADYVWEKWEQSDWIKLNVPNHTCILYAWSIGRYRCQVSEKTYQFHVIDKDKPEGDCSGGQLPMELISMVTVIGEGSFGVVYKGKYNGADVAVKRIRLPPDFNALSIPQEVMVLKNLKHPNIIHFMGYCINKDCVLLVTNYIDGNNLDIILFSSRISVKLSEEEAIKIGVQIIDAVHYMHNHDPVIIHQDLKPQNVLVSKNYQKISLCDMGIAKLKHLSETTVTANTTGPGTYPYMAPEMFMKSRRGPAVDIYSLGCLYIELFGRKRIWANMDGPSIMRKVLGTFNCPPESPKIDHINPVFQSLIKNMCSLDATQRPRSRNVFTSMTDIAAHNY